MKPRLLVTLILFSILAWGILPLEAAPPVTLTPAYCGQILYGPTRYQLTADLACPRGANVTLNSATLDMNGHSIMCNSFGPCVKLTGQGSRLMHGAISPFQADGMELVGAGGHQVLDVTIGNTDGTMWVLSPNNTITNVRMVSYVNPAIWVGTDGNRIIQSTAQCIFLLSAGCIDILGDFNAVTGNEVSVGGEQSHLSIKASIHVAGDQNFVAHNHAESEQAIGLRVSGLGNVLVGNRLHGQPLDATDMHGDCGHNVWAGNQGDQADPACVLHPAVPAVARQ